jgi:hypothetical protein
LSIKEALEGGNASNEVIVCQVFKRALDLQFLGHQARNDFQVLSRLLLAGLLDGRYAVLCEVVSQRSHEVALKAVPAGYGLAPRIGRYARLEPGCGSCFLDLGVRHSLFLRFL